MKVEVVVNETIEKEVVVEVEDFFHIPGWAVPNGFVCAKCENPLDERLCLVVKTTEGIIYMHRHCFQSYFGIEDQKPAKKKTTIGKKK